MILLHNARSNEFVHLAWPMSMCLKCLHGSHRQIGNFEKNLFLFRRLSAHIYVSKPHYGQYTKSDTALKYEYKSQPEKTNNLRAEMCERTAFGCASWKLNECPEQKRLDWRCFCLPTACFCTDNLLRLMRGIFVCSGWYSANPPPVPSLTKFKCPQPTSELPLPFLARTAPWYTFQPEDNGSTSHYVSSFP